jgi:hypothetical protein
LGAIWERDDSLLAILAACCAAGWLGLGDKVGCDPSELLDDGAVALQRRLLATELAFESWSIGPACVKDIAIAPYAFALLGGTAGWYPEVGTVGILAEVDLDPVNFGRDPRALYAGPPLTQSKILICP